MDLIVGLFVSVFFALLAVFFFQGLSQIFGRLESFQQPGKVGTGTIVSKKIYPSFSTGFDYYPERHTLTIRLPSGRCELVSVTNDQYTRMQENDSVVISYTEGKFTKTQRIKALCL
jgi:hypothetical protein